MKVEEIIVVIRFLAKFAFVGSSMHQISVKWMSDKHQMPSDNTNSTYLIMESIHYWSHFIGFILWGVNFLESLYSRVRILGFFKQFKRKKYIAKSQNCWWFWCLNCLKNPNILTLLCKDSKKLTPHKMNPMKWLQ